MIIRHKANIEVVQLRKIVEKAVKELISDSELSFSVYCAVMGKIEPAIEWERVEEKEGEQMTELKHCPFCGNIGELHRKGLEEDNWWVVECTNDLCPASYMIGNKYSSKEEAAEVWNTRAKV